MSKSWAMRRMYTYIDALASGKAGGKSQGCGNLGDTQHNKRKRNRVKKLGEVEICIHKTVYIDKRYKDTKIQRYKDTNIQRYKDTKIQRYK